MTKNRVIMKTYLEIPATSASRWFQGQQIMALDVATMKIEET